MHLSIYQSLKLLSMSKPLEGLYEEKKKVIKKDKKLKHNAACNVSLSSKKDDKLLTGLYDLIRELSGLFVLWLTKEQHMVKDD